VKVWIAYIGGEVEGKGMGWVGRANIHVQQTSEKTVFLCKKPLALVLVISRGYLIFRYFHGKDSLACPITSQPIANLAIKFPIHNYHHSLRSYLQG